MAWIFNPNEYEAKEFSIIPAGDHRVRIGDVVGKTFKSGNNGFEITLEVSGHGGSLWFYLVLDPTDTKKTNQRIGTFFESFDITDYDLSHYRNWIGKVGGARVKHEEYNGSTRAKVHYLLNKSKQDELPPWQGKVATAQPTAVEIDPDELPF